MGNIVTDDMISISLNGSQISEKICCPTYDGGYRTTSTKSHGLSSQKAAGITHTGFETARIDRYKVLCVAGLHPQSSRPFK